MESRRSKGADSQFRCLVCFGADLLRSEFGVEVGVDVDVDVS